MGVEMHYIAIIVVFVVVGAMFLAGISALIGDTIYRWRHRREGAGTRQ